MKLRQLAAVVCIVVTWAGTLQADKFSFKGLSAPSGKLGEALAAMAQGKLDVADAKLKEVLQQYPGLALADLARAQILVDTKQLVDADRIVTGVLAREPASPTAHNMKGVVLLLQKKSELARGEFNQAIALSPAYVTPRIYVAAISRASGNLQQSAADYRAVVGAAPRLPVGYLGLAEAQMLQNQRAAALKTLNDWKAADATTVLPFQVGGSVFLAENDPQAAIGELKGGLARKPGDPGLLTTMGFAYAATGDDKSAATQYQAALAADPAMVDAYLGQAELDLKAGRRDDAIGRYRGALKADPTNPVAGNDLAWLLADRGGRADLDEALRTATTVVNDAPDYVDARDTLGWIQYLRSDFTNAVATLKKAKTMAPTRLDIAGHLGLAYAKAGRKAEAIPELKRALASKAPIPNRAELERVLAEVSKLP